MTDKMKQTITITICIIIVIFALSISYTTVFTEKDINLEISTILSIILALFSIGLSAKFYFDASKTSNDFYRNSFDYMKQQSELLIKIDEKFGGKFENLDGQMLLLINAIESKDKAYLNLETNIDQKISNIKNLLNDGKIDKDEVSNLNNSIKYIETLIDNYKDTNRMISENVIGKLKSPRESHGNVSKGIIYPEKINETDQDFLVRNELLYSLNMHFNLLNEYKEIEDMIDSIIFKTDWYLNKDIQNKMIKIYTDWLRKYRSSKKDIDFAESSFIDYFNSIANI